MGRKARGGSTPLRRMMESLQRRGFHRASTLLGSDRRSGTEKRRTCGNEGEAPPHLRDQDGGSRGPTPHPAGVDGTPGLQDRPSSTPTTPPPAREGEMVERAFRGPTRGLKLSATQITSDDLTVPQNIESAPGVTRSLELRALWAARPVEVRLLSGASRKPRSGGVFVVSVNGRPSLRECASRRGRRRNVRRLDRRVLVELQRLGADLRQPAWCELSEVDQLLDLLLAVPRRWARS